MFSAYHFINNPKEKDELLLWHTFVISTSNLLFLLVWLIFSGGLARCINNAKISNANISYVEIILINYIVWYTKS